MSIKSWWTVVLVGLAIVNAPERLVAQTRGSRGTPPNRPAAGSDRPSSPTRLGFRPSPPLPPSSNQPLGRPKMLAPRPFAGPRRSFGVRSVWFGLVAFDRSWLWTPSGVDETVAALPPASFQELPVGGLQLDVEPRRAVAYVDGWYAGVVDEFSGYYHHLDVTAGVHVIEIVAPDYEPLVLEVSISQGRTTTYRSSLQRAQGRH